jgi:arylsulfatase A-like enzyme
MASRLIGMKGSPKLPEGLAAALADTGLVTVGLTGGGWVSWQRGFDQGFDHYGAEQRVGAGVPELVGDTLAWLDRLEDVPAFLFLHTYAIHAPYDPPAADAAPFLDPGYGGRLPASRSQLERAAGTDHDDQSHWFWSHVDKGRPEDLRRLRDLYDGGIHYTDAQLGAFLDWLRGRPTWGRTLLIVLSDHGEEFGEHGHFQHETLHQETLHVPLLVRFPDPPPAPGPRRVPDVVRLVDVLPTLFEQLGIPAAGPVQGQSLLPLLESGASEPREVLSQVRPGGPASLQAGEWKLIRSGDRIRLFQVSLDPGEHEDRRLAEPRRAGALRVRMDRLLAESEALGRSFGAGEAVEVDPAWHRELEALGYLGKDGDGPDTN